MITICRVSITHLVAVLLVFLVSGCQVTPHSSDSPQQTEHSAKYNQENENLKRCQAQLEALKTMNQPDYNRLNNSFIYLMTSAAQYSGMRKNVDANTQDTVDSLYHYRANLICSKIAQTLMDSLASKGEAHP